MAMAGPTGRPTSAAAGARCLPGSSERFTPEQCDDIQAARQAIVAGAADLVWGGVMYEGEERQVSLNLRPQSQPRDPGESGEGTATIVGFDLAEEMAVALEGAAFLIEPKSFQEIRLASNRQELAHWKVTPREGTGASSPGKKQILFVKIRARARLADGRLVDLQTIPKSYPIMVTIKPLTWWRHFWRDLGAVFTAPVKALDELALLLAAIGGVGAAYWAMRKKLAGGKDPSPSSPAKPSPRRRGRRESP
jgi:hypothetical protein